MIVAILSKKINRVKSENGSFTIEATLIFPLVFIIILTLLLFCVYMFQKVVLFQQASLTAERTSFIWNNSNRDADTGKIALENNIHEDFDGLYLELFLDNERKLDKALEHANFKYHRQESSVDSYILFSSINVYMERYMDFPDFYGTISPYDDTAYGKVTRQVNDPPGFIRNIDFGMYAIDKVEGIVGLRDHVGDDSYGSGAKLDD